MFNNRNLFLFIGAFLFVSAATVYGGDKVSICHIPPGNPENAHIINVSAKAIPAHKAHGDLNLTMGEEEEGNLCTDGIDNDCDTFVDADDSGCQRQFKYVFVTSSDHNGKFDDVNLTGLQGADKLCNDLAEPHRILSGDPLFGAGEFTAWLSGPGNAIDRIGESTLLNQEYRLVDGTVIDFSKDSSGEFNINHLINITEENALKTPSDVFPSVWTGTLRTGLVATNTCGDWTGTGSLGVHGSYAGTLSDWTAIGGGFTRSCSRRAALYCFEN